VLVGIQAQISEQGEQLPAALRGQGEAGVGGELGLGLALKG
jgi:hypothetical protein